MRSEAEGKDHIRHNIVIVKYYNVNCYYVNPSLSPRQAHATSVDLSRRNPFFIGFHQQVAKMAPRQPKDGPKTAQERSKRAPRRLQSDAREPKTGKDGSKTVHEGSKTAQEALQGIPKRAREAKIIGKLMVFV